MCCQPDGDMLIDEGLFGNGNRKTLGGYPSPTPSFGTGWGTRRWSGLMKSQHDTPVAHKRGDSKWTSVLTAIS